MLRMSPYLPKQIYNLDMPPSLSQNNARNRCFIYAVNGAQLTHAEFSSRVIPPYTDDYLICQLGTACPFTDRRIGSASPDLILSVGIVCALIQVRRPKARRRIACVANQLIRLDGPLKMLKCHTRDNLGLPLSSRSVHDRHSSVTVWGSKAHPQPATIWGNVQILKKSLVNWFAHSVNSCSRDLVVLGAANTITFSWCPLHSGQPHG